jgi:hypothetical protein
VWDVCTSVRGEHCNPPSQIEFCPHSEVVPCNDDSEIAVYYSSDPTCSMRTQTVMIGNNPALLVLAGP